MLRIRVVLRLLTFVVPLCLWLGSNVTSPPVAFGLTLVPLIAAYFAVRIWAPPWAPQVFTDAMIRRHASESVALVLIGWTTWVGIQLAMAALWRPEMVNRDTVLAAFAFVFPVVLVHALFVFVRDQIVLRRRRSKAGVPVDGYAEAFD